MESDDANVDDYDIFAVTAVLQSMGLETDGMSDAEKVSLYHSLVAEEEEEGGDYGDDDEAAAAETDIHYGNRMMMHNAESNDSSDASVDINDYDTDPGRPPSEGDIVSPHNIGEALGSPDTTSATATSATSATTGPGSGWGPLTELMRMKVIYVKDTLVVSEAEAETLLRASNWDELWAVARHFEEGSSASAMTVGGGAERHHHQEDQYMGGHGPAAVAGGGWQRDEDIAAALAAAEAAEAAQAAEVRAPDSTKRERLIGGPARGGGGGGRNRDGGGEDRGGGTATHLTSEYLRERTAQMQRAAEMAEPEGVNWVFSLPPNYPICPLLLHEARTAAVKAQKWLVVHIQCSDALQYHHMNRDLWPQETVAEVLRSGYVFWARGSRSIAGTTFLRLYGLGAVETAAAASALFPAIFILDPRTGALVKSMKSRSSLDAPELASFLMDFSDAHPTFDWTPPPPPPGTTSTATATASTAANATTTGATSGTSAQQKQSPDTMKAPATVSVPRPRADYGPVPPDDKDVPDALRLGFKMSNGKSLMRYFRGSDPVTALFAFALQCEAAAADSDVIDVELATVDAQGRHLIPCFSTPAEPSEATAATAAAASPSNSEGHVDCIAARKLVGSRIIVTAVKR